MRKFKNGDTVQLTNNAPNRLKELYGDDHLTVLSYHGSSYYGNSSYRVRPKDNLDGHIDTVETRYLEKVKVKVDVMKTLEDLRGELEKLNGKRNALDKEINSVQERIDFMEVNKLTVFKESQFKAAKAVQLIRSGNLSDIEVVKEIEKMFSN